MNNSFNKVQDHEKRDSTDEFILLSILVSSKKYGYRLQRMQIAKLIQKIKQYLQDNLSLQVYHSELLKDKHGDFTPKIYDQLTSLKQSNLIESSGEEPYEKFYPTPLGEQVSSKIRMSKGEDEEKLNTIRKYINDIIKSDGGKSSEQLKDENHQRRFIYNGSEVSMDELPLGFTTTPNLREGEFFIFDDRVTIDWQLYRKLAIRKRQQVTPDSEIPQTQVEVHEILGLVE